VPKILLQRLQPFFQRLDLVLVEEILQELDGITQFLQGDSQFVPLLWCQLAELSAALARLPPATLDQPRRYVADGREEQGGLPRYRLIMPALRLEPLRE